jgi:hypothetical protein
MFKSIRNDVLDCGSGETGISRAAERAKATRLGHGGPSFEAAS